MSTERIEVLKDIGNALENDCHIKSCYDYLTEDLDMNEDERLEILDAIGERLKGKKREYVFYIGLINDCIDEFSGKLSNYISREFFGIVEFSFNTAEFETDIRKAIGEHISKKIKKDTEKNDTSSA